MSKKEKELYSKIQSFNEKYKICDYEINSKEILIYFLYRFFMVKANSNIINSTDFETVKHIANEIDF
jgi:hypothetical protein